MSEEIHEQVFQVGMPALLNLNNIRGSIVILPQDPSLQERTILVRGVKDLESGDGEYTTIEMAQREDGQVVVETRYIGQDKLGFLQIKHKPCLITYTVQVPKNCSIRVESVSGSIEIEKLEGEFNISSVSGAIALIDLSGEIRCQSVSGQIRAERLNGPTNCENVSGNIQLLQSQIPALEAKTVSGEILVDIAGQAEPYSFHTVSGDLTLILAEEQGISIQMQSLSGKLHIHHPDGIASQKAPHDLAVQGGGLPIGFDTISGDLHLTTPELHQKDATGNQEVGATAQHNVLESVARGEMTAEEGLHALKSSSAE
jgi:hypothetical protein